MTSEAMEQAAARETTTAEPPRPETREESDSTPDGREVESATESARSPRNYRKRARQAERKLEATERDLEAARQALAEREATIDQLERRERVNALLVEADAIDLPSARLLAEVELEAMDEPDPAEAIAELKRAKPFLFRTRNARRTSGVLSPAPETPRHGDVEMAAEEAMRTGRRGDVLRYLRLRRGRPA